MSEQHYHTISTRKSKVFADEQVPKDRPDDVRETSRTGRYTSTGIVEHEAGIRISWSAGPRRSM